MRRDIFYKSKHELDTINKNRSIILELDQMDDWTRDELAKSFGVLTTTKLNRKSVCQSLKPASRYGSIRNILKMGSPAPDSFDWRRVPGSVSRAKDQGPCGNSWAFATTGLLEGQLLQYNYNALPNGQAISLSEQFLIDCSGANCVGMYPWDAIDVLIKTGGIPPEDKYAPYKGYLGQCKPNRRDLVLGDYLVGYDTICNEQLNDEDIKKLVYNYGPVVIGIHGNKNFAKHVPAIAARDIIDIDCNDVTEGNYAALIVGWGQDAKRGQFWIIVSCCGYSTQQQTLAVCVCVCLLVSCCG